MNNQWTIGVVGAGTMGRGIAQVAAQHGHDVWLQDVASEIVEDAIAQISHFVRRGAEKGRYPAAEAEAIIQRIHTTTEVASFASQPDRIVGFAALPPLDGGSLFEVAGGCILRTRRWRRPWGSSSRWAGRRSK